MSTVESSSSRATTRRAGRRLHVVRAPMWPGRRPRRAPNREVNRGPIPHPPNAGRPRAPDEVPPRCRRFVGGSRRVGRALCERSPGTEVVLLRRRKKFCNGDSPDSLLTQPPCCRCRQRRLRSREMAAPVGWAFLDLAEEVVAWTRRNCSVGRTETVAKDAPKM